MVSLAAGDLREGLGAAELRVKRVALFLCGVILPVRAVRVAESSRSVFGIRLKLFSQALVWIQLAQ